jgi:hypothetical protein
LPFNMVIVIRVRGGIAREARSANFSILLLSESRCGDSAMPMTVTIADDLAMKLHPYQAQFPEILELGIREWCARSEPGYHGVNDVLEKLAALPTPEEVLALRPTLPLQERLDALMEKNRAGGLSADDQREWDQYKFLEHLVRLAKANAARKIKNTLFTSDER